MDISHKARWAAAAVGVALTFGTGPASAVPLDPPPSPTPGGPAMKGPSTHQRRKRQTIQRPWCRAGWSARRPEPDKGTRVLIVTKDALTEQDSCRRGNTASRRAGLVEALHQLAGLCSVSTEGGDPGSRLPATSGVNTRVTMPTSPATISMYAGTIGCRCRRPTLEQSAASSRRKPISRRCRRWPALRYEHWSETAPASWQVEVLSKHSSIRPINSTPTKISG